MSETLGHKSIETKFPYHPHQYRTTAEMTLTFETWTLRYELRFREIYIEEHTSITSLEILLEPPRRRMTV